MKLIKSTYTYILVLLAGILTFSSIGAIEYYQGDKINKDGSITLEITYSASNKEIKDGNNIIGTLPFTPALVKEYFSFPGAEVKKAIVYRDHKDTANRTSVTVELTAKDFSKIKQSKALKDVTVTWEKKDSGAVFVWFISADDLRKNLLETYQVVLKSEPEIKSTNGLMKDNQVTWFVYGNKDNKYGAYFVTTVKADDMEMSAGKDSTTSSDPKEKSCGLFGLELPVILLFGLFLTSRLRKRNS